MLVGCPDCLRRVNVNGHAVSAASKHKEALFKWMDFMISPAGQHLSNFGKLGDTAKVLPDGSWGYMDHIQTPGHLEGQYRFDEYYGFSAYGTKMVWSKEHHKTAWPSEEFNAAAKMYEENDWGVKLMAGPKFQKAEVDELTEIESSIKDYSNSMTSKFIVNGNFGDWNDFVAKVKAMKVDRLVELYNTVHQRDKKR